MVVAILKVGHGNMENGPCTAVGSTRVRGVGRVTDTPLLCFVDVQCLVSLVELKLSLGLGCVVELIVCPCRSHAEGGW